MIAFPHVMRYLSLNELLACYHGKGDVLTDQKGPWVHLS